jgi:hypothetical protein
MTIVTEKKNLIIAGVLVTLLLVLGGVILFTVYKTSQNETVAPTVPQVVPEAAEPNCSLAFTVTTTPTPTPLYLCDSECTTNSQCPSGLICSANRCRNASCVDRNNCVCTIPTPTPTPMYVCDSVCSSSSQCPPGLVCDSNRCRNPNCVDRNNCQCVTMTPTPTPYITVTPPPVPQSGWEVPTIVTTVGGALLLLIAKLLL